MDGTLQLTLTRLGNAAMLTQRTQGEEAAVSNKKKRNAWGMVEQVGCSCTCKRDARGNNCCARQWAAATQDIDI